MERPEEGKAGGRYLRRGIVNGKWRDVDMKMLGDGEMGVTYGRRDKCER